MKRKPDPLELTRFLIWEVRAHRRNPRRSLRELRQLLPSGVSVEKIYRHPGHLRFTVKKGAMKGTTLAGVGLQFHYEITMFVVRRWAGEEDTIKDRFGLRAKQRVKW